MLRSDIIPDTIVCANSTIIKPRRVEDDGIFLLEGGTDFMSNFGKIIGNFIGSFNGKFKDHLRFAWRPINSGFYDRKRKEGESYCCVNKENEQEPGAVDKCDNYEDVVIASQENNVGKKQLTCHLGPGIFSFSLRRHWF